QARRLQARAGLVRAGVEDRSGPRQDLAVLWAVADRAGQPRAGTIPSRKDRAARRHRQRRISFARRRAGAAVGQRTCLLSTVKADVNGRVAVYATRPCFYGRASLCCFGSGGATMARFLK